ncbi:MAG: hypothetical protein WAV90_09715 [Gordonia amarae]
MNTSPMWLVWKDARGRLHYQPWDDVDSVGGLIDPDTGDDMELVGWTEKRP